jgi:preprotein translocase subunit YajC
MNNKNIFITIVSVVLIFGFLYGAYYFLNESDRKEVARKKSLKKTNEVILYWGVTCEHCKKVEDYLKNTPDIEKKIKIIRKEVFNDKTNVADMEDKAYLCNFDTSKGIGVPFMYFKGECISGDQPIIDYLTQKAKD